MRRVSPTRGARVAPEIPRQIAASVASAPRSPRRVEREFHARLAGGAELCCAGSERRRPERLLADYPPRFRIDLFDTTFFLSRVRQNEDVRFFVGYVAQPPRARGHPRIWARLFYKDVSLVWRSASHCVVSARENWIGKGDVRTVIAGGEEFEVSHESTTDLPLEVQNGFEALSAGARRVTYDRDAVPRVLRRAPDHRIAAYRDFTQPRLFARTNPRNVVNRGRPIARFTRVGDPDSLRFVPGFAPDFRRGVLEASTSRSSLYGGELRRFRILSENQEVQFLFMAAPRHVWIVPPQALTTELSSYGVRTVGVEVDDDLTVPGWEYHGGHHHGLSGLDQIPRGFAGERNSHDPSRADASPWLDRLPVIREFRRRVLRAE